MLRPSLRQSALDLRGGVATIGVSPRESVRVAPAGKDWEVCSAVSTSTKCYQAKAGELDHQWYVIDATDQVVGRLAARDRADLDGQTPADLHRSH